MLYTKSCARKIKVLLKETWSEVDRLTADAAMLSSMFRQQAVEQKFLRSGAPALVRRHVQVEEYESAVKERDAVSSELSKARGFKRCV